MMNEKLFEGWKQVADQMSLSERQTYRYYQLVKNQLTLEHYLGRGTRMKMTQEEINTFKSLISISKNYQSDESFDSIQKEMSDDGMICQG